MNINKAIIEAKKRKNISYDTIAKSLPRKANGKNKVGKDVSATLVNNDNMSTKTILPILRILGYELVIQEVRQGVRRDDQIVITDEDGKPKKGHIVLLKTLDENVEESKKKIKLLPKNSIDDILDNIGDGE